MQNISFGRGSAPPQQPNPSAPAAADTNIDPEPPRASALAPASAAASESGPPLLESEEHWPALDMTNYYKPKKRGGRGRGRGRRGRGGASAGESNSREGAPASSSSPADPTVKSQARQILYFQIFIFTYTTLQSYIFRCTSRPEPDC